MSNLVALLIFVVVHVASIRRENAEYFTIGLVRQLLQFACGNVHLLLAARPRAGAAFASCVHKIVETRKRCFHGALSSKLSFLSMVILILAMPST